METPDSARKPLATSRKSAQQHLSTPSTQRRLRRPHSQARRTTATEGNARQRLKASSNNTKQRPVAPRNAPKRPEERRWLRNCAWWARQRQPGDANPATVTQQRQPTSVEREITAHGYANRPPSLSLGRTPPGRFSGSVGRAGAGGPARSWRRRSDFPEPPFKPISPGRRAGRLPASLAQPTMCRPARFRPHVAAGVLKFSMVRPFSRRCITPANLKVQETTLWRGTAPRASFERRAVPPFLM